ncbi:pyruvate dehydrogenase complex dihydrolipoamide acetyltransferase [Aestuariivirga sp. YIM B02566]|uniref:Pyruvate dehydrogenase complex dihydrolipoamide acetyltransferase n=1 Tax=Taklimakanibacter albus TaxID=2800327 RepID=A0ACC5R1J4_9HYPH|nr:pyruvate dehydrogenase complex dihydrolipoamide acetyltransferase [Aestuariivirga sp. YIM B02566]MBK1866529.1 pyruvate dehydrogenase complex dihydrolipoamide acetyltransferase [Aestuariivirga sp. YIM B02566]
MPTNILMPALSPTMEKGKLAKWLKKEGDTVKSGDILAEIETDKATMEVEAVDEGIVGKILIAEGTDEVAVNTPIAVLLGEGEQASDIKAGAAPAPAAPKPAAAAPAAAPPAKADAAAAAPAAKPQAPAPAAKANGQAGGRVFASPLARRIAKDKGIDLAALQGSGPHGRVVLKDVENAKPGTKAPTAAAAAGAPTQLAAPMADEAIVKLFEPGSFEVVPHDGMRKVIASRLMQAKQTIPHFYLTISCDLENLLGVRERLNAHAPRDKEKNPAWKLSVNDFVIKALALALQRVPDANATWTEGGMLKHKHSDVGVAVAIEGGLFTPIIRKAETKTLSAISLEMKDLAARARKRRLAPQEYQGGTTAVSNLGMYGIENFSAVINPPHATILAVGAGEKKPAVVGDKIEIRTQMMCTLSVDHRAVDGALGAQLLQAFKVLIEEPALMMA